MSTFSSDPTWRPDPPSNRPWLGLVVLVGFVLLIGAVAYLMMEVQGARSVADDARLKVSAYEERIAKLEASVQQTLKKAEASVSALQGQMKSAKGQNTQAEAVVSQQELRAALKKTQQYVEQLTEQQKAEIAKVGGELQQQLQSVATETETKLGSLSGDLGGVKSDVSATKAELQKAVAELKSVRGDMGVQSGLIATNGKELAALRRLGERDYFEFDLGKSKEPQRVGRIAIKLKGTNTRRNRYTIEVIADDKVTEKKDRTINEPVQFYMPKSRIPWEIVVNAVERNRIRGYLATPKNSE